MLINSITTIARNLNDYLRLRFSLNEDIVFISPPHSDTKSLPSNRICLTIINIEKENIGGMNFKAEAVSSKRIRQSTINWNLNIYLLISAVFLEKQYSDSLKILSGALSFFQSIRISEKRNQAEFISLEIVNLSFHELSNVWSILGGEYHPSFLCKIRTAGIDESEISAFQSIIGKPLVNSELK